MFLVTILALKQPISVWRILCAKPEPGDSNLQAWGWRCSAPTRAGHMEQGAGLQAEGLSETPLEGVTEAS